MTRSYGRTVRLAGMLLASALLFGLITPDELARGRTQAILAAFITTTTLWAVIHFSRYFSPLSDWTRRRPGADLPLRQRRRAPSPHVGPADTRPIAGCELDRECLVVVPGV